MEITVFEVYGDDPIITANEVSEQPNIFVLDRQFNSVGIEQGKIEKWPKTSRVLFRLNEKAGKKNNVIFTSGKKDLHTRKSVNLLQHFTIHVLRLSRIHERPI